MSPVNGIERSLLETQIGESAVFVWCEKETVQPGPRIELKAACGFKGQAGEGCS